MTAAKAAPMEPVFVAAALWVVDAEADALVVVVLDPETDELPVEEADDLVAVIVLEFARCSSEGSPGAGRGGRGGQ